MAFVGHYEMLPAKLVLCSSLFAMVFSELKYSPLSIPSSIWPLHLNCVLTFRAGLLGFAALVAVCVS